MKFYNLGHKTFETDFRSFLTFVTGTERFLAIWPSQCKFFINERLMKKSVYTVQQ